jgi:sugar phosphate isomerase/epimerase
MPTRYLRAFSTLGCPDLALDEALMLAGRNGIDALEIRTLEGTTDIPALFSRTGEGAVLRALARGLPVRVLALSTSFRLVGPGEADRAALLAFVPWAEAMGVPWLRVFDGGLASDPGTVHLAAQTHSWWRRLRSENGWKVDLMVETHDGLLTQDAINGFCSEAAGASVLWDAHNTWRATGVDPFELWPRIAKHVVHIHVKDSVSRPSGRFPYTYVLPGDGEFPMGRLAGALGRDGYTKPVSLEWERQWHPELPPLELALRASASRGWF